MFLTRRFNCLKIIHEHSCFRFNDNDIAEMAMTDNLIN